VRDRSEKRAPIGSPSRHSSSPRTLLLRAGFHDAARAGRLLGDPALLSFLLDDPQSDDGGEEGVIPGGFASADRSPRLGGRPAEIRLGPEREELIDTLALTADPDMALLRLVRPAAAATAGREAAWGTWEATTSSRVAIMSGTMSAVAAEASRSADRTRGAARRVRIDSPMGSAIRTTKACAKGLQLIPPP